MISESLWIISLPGGRTLGERVSWQSPAIREFQPDSLNAFTKVWEERLGNARRLQDNAMEKSRVRYSLSWRRDHLRIWLFYCGANLNCLQCIIEQKNTCL